MAVLRKQFVVLLIISYICSFLTPTSTGCTCQTDGLDRQTTEHTESKSGCCQGENGLTCCSPINPVNTSSNYKTEQHSGCCPSEGLCYNCRLCHPVEQYLPTQNRIPVKPIHELTSVNPVFVVISADPIIRAVFKKPPNQTTLACHIPTTVLLC